MSAPQVIRHRLAGSLRWRLALSVSGLILLCIAVCVAGAVIFLNRALTDQATTDMRHTLNGVSGYVDSQGSDLLGAARLISTDPIVIRAATHHRRQDLVVHLSPLYADLNANIMDVIDANGQVIVRMENTGANGDNVGMRPSIQSTLAGNEEVAVETDLPQVAGPGGYALRATVPIRNSDNQILGAVVVGRQLDNSLAARIGHAVAAQVNLIAGNQRTGTTLTDSHGFAAPGITEPQSMPSRVATGHSSIDFVHENGHASLSGLVPLDGPDGRPVGAVEVVRGLDPVYNVIQLLSFLLMALGAFVVVIGALLALWISRRLTSRLMVLEQTASQVASLSGTDAPLGSLDVTEAVEGNDEVASLARSFSAMMSALDQRMAANANLYAAAQERVRELSGLAEIARLLTAVPSVRETIDILGEQVCRLVGCSAVAIWLPGEGSVPALYGGHGLPLDYEVLTNQVLLDLAGTSFETAAQTALRTGQVTHSQIAEELQTGRSSAAYLALRDGLQAMSLRAATAVPLHVQGRIVGALTCYTQSDKPLSGSDLGLLTTIADQVAVAVENARLYTRSRDLAAVEERQRLSRELHDSVSQALYGIALGAKTAHALLEIDPKRVAEPLEYVLAQAEAGLAEMRALIFELRPEALETEGLVAAMSKQVESARARHALTVDAHLGIEPDAPFAVKEAIYRIAQEALHNTIKHAHASTVTIRLEWDGEDLALEMSDDGKGFDPEGNYPGHLGLQSMRERAMRLHGTMDIESAVGKGTRLRVEIPANTPARVG